MTQDLYHQGIESLNRHSDEKEVYVAKLGEYIDRYGVESLLDIGAGDGEVALPISQEVDRYVAIEQRSDYAAVLRNAGKEVIERAFPTTVEGTFDLVVMSHIISHNLGNYTELVPPAWELVKPEGRLLIVTHRGSDEDAWSNLLERIGLGYSSDSTATLGALIDDLRERGETETEEVATHLRSDNAPALLGAMAFLAASGGQSYYDRFMASGDQVVQILNDEYREEDGFSFPLRHPFISTTKAAA